MYITWERYFLIEIEYYPISQIDIIYNQNTE